MTAYPLPNGSVLYRRANGCRPTTRSFRFCWSCRRNALKDGQPYGSRCDWCQTRPIIKSRLERLGVVFLVVCSCGWRDTADTRLLGHRLRAEHEAAQHPGYYYARKAADQARFYARSRKEAGMN